MMLNGGDMWWDFSNSRYEVPAGSGKTPLFAGAIWMGGLNDTGGLHLASQRYRQVGNDFFPGPLDSAGSIMVGECADYDRHWRINKTTIQDFVAGLLNPIPDEILTWPGKGNPNGPTAISNLAPFVDVNNDGIYDANDGDYPLIKGDQAVWWVFNDAGNVHTNSTGNQLGVEVHVMAYAYQAANDINNSTFYNYTVINKSSNTYQDFYLGIFTDVDLGNSQDDYIGCNPSLNLGFGYNGDGFDDSGFSIGYGTELPVIGIKMLQLPKDENGNSMDMSSFGYIAGFPGLTGDPSIASEYYNRLQGLWNTGDPYREGGFGTDTNNPVTSYIYPGNPGNGAEWSECSAQTTPAERKFVQSFGPMTLNPWKPVTFTYSAIFSQDTAYDGTCPDLTGYFNVVEDVQDFHDSTHCNHFQTTLTGTVDDTVNAGENPSIDLEVSGGNTFSLYYNWSNGVTTQDLDSVSPFTSYTVTVSDDFGCFDIATFDVGDTTVIQAPVDTTDTTGNDTIDTHDPQSIAKIGLAKIRVYPNPSQDGFFNIDQAPESLVVEVWDVLGNRVMTRAVQESIDLRDQPAGVYFIHLSGSSGMASTTRKVLITK